MSEPATKPAAVYAAINAVQAGLAAAGIKKTRENIQQRYKFRGIDDLYNALAPLLAEHKLCILPRVLARECVERKSTSGNPLFYVLVDVEFDLVSAADGSKHTIRTVGEAMDSADKATNKAMSAAYKYACFMAFAIPTEGDHDTENTTPEVAGEDVDAALAEFERRQKATHPTASPKPTAVTAEADGPTTFWAQMKKAGKDTLAVEAALKMPVAAWVTAQPGRTWAMAAEAVLKGG